MGKYKYTVTEVKQAIIDAEGNLTEAARILDCARGTVYNYIKTYQAVKAAYESSNEKALDVAEGVLMKQVRKGNMTAVIFFLKTKGKSRGYVERQEVTGADGADIHVTLTRPGADAS